MYDAATASRDRLRRSAAKASGLCAPGFSGRHRLSRGPPRGRGPCRPGPVGRQGSGNGPGWRVAQIIAGRTDRGRNSRESRGAPRADGARHRRGVGGLVGLSIGQARPNTGQEATDSGSRPGWGNSRVAVPIESRRGLEAHTLGGTRSSPRGWTGGLGPWPEPLTANLTARVARHPADGRIDGPYQQAQSPTAEPADRLACGLRRAGESTTKAARVYTHAPDRWWRLDRSDCRVYTQAVKNGAHSLGKRQETGMYLIERPR